MRRAEFREGSPGQLVRITDGWAFVPAPLPPSIEPSWELTRRLDAATQALAKLDGQASRIPNKTLVLRPLLTREAVESARLEGTHTHIAGVLLQGAAGPPRDPTEASNNQEVLNYLHALWEGEAWIQDGRPFGLPLIRALHSVLLSGTRGQSRRPGEFRPAQVLIGAPGDTPDEARFVPPPPEHVQPAMENLVRFVKQPGHYPPLIAAGIVHYQFETIHPFEDGNGRLGRLLIPLQLMVTSTIDQPLIYLSPFFEARRDEYLRLLKEVSTEGTWLVWMSFFLEAVRSQAEDARGRAEQILALHETYRSRAQTQARSRVPPVTVDLIMDQVIVTVSQVAEFARCDYRTARSALDTLTRLGITAPLENSYPQRWWAPELIQQVYET